MSATTVTQSISRAMSRLLTEPGSTELGSFAEDPAFRDLATLAAAACRRAVAGVFVLAGDGAREGAWHGSEDRVSVFDTPCWDVVRSGSEIEIPDLRLDGRWGTMLSAYESRDGSYAGAPIFDAHGAVIGTVCVGSYEPGLLTDDAWAALRMIAARASAHVEARAAHGALVRSQERLRAVVGALPDGVVLVDPDGRVELANAAFVEIVDAGKTAGDLVGERFATRIRDTAAHYPDPEAFTTRVAELLARREPVHDEELRRTCGQVILRDYIPVRDAFGEVGHLWHLRDITHSRELAANLESSEQRFATLTTAAPVSIFALDTAFNMTAHGDQLARFAPAGGTGAWSDLFPQDERAATRATYRESMLVGRPVTAEHGLLDRDGRRRQVAVRLAPVRDPEGELQGWVGTLTDVTDQRVQERRLAVAEAAREAERETRLATERAARIAAEAAREELARSNAELRRVSDVKDTLMASVSHELRTPLTAMGTFTELLADSGLDPAQKDLLEVVARNRVRLETLVADLLLLKDGQAAMRLELQPVDVGAIFADAAASASVTAAAAGIALRVDAEPDATVWAAPERVAQIVDNLVVNAVKYLDGPGEVLLTAQRCGEVTRIIVADDGPGIPSADVEHVFESFYQGANGRERGQGSGLGLRIVRFLTEAMGGDVTLDSGDGVGTRVTVALPAEAR